MTVIDSHSIETAEQIKKQIENWIDKIKVLNYRIWNETEKLFLIALHEWDDVGNLTPILKSVNAELVALKGQHWQDTQQFLESDG